MQRDSPEPCCAKFKDMVRLGRYRWSKAGGAWYWVDGLSVICVCRFCGRDLPWRRKGYTPIDAIKEVHRAIQDEEAGASDAGGMP